MILQSLHILNYRNIREASLEFGDKLNCFVGLNGQGKTNVLDAIYLLSFAKSAFTSQDSLNITHGEEMAMVQGVYNDGMINGDASLNEELDLSWLAYEIVSINIPVVHCHQAGECNKQMELLLQDHLCDEPEPEE